MHVYVMTAEANTRVFANLESAFAAATEDGYDVRLDAETGYVPGELFIGGLWDREDGKWYGDIVGPLEVEGTIPAKTADCAAIRREIEARWGNEKVVHSAVICKQLSMHSHQIHNAIKTMVDKGSLKRIGRGQFEWIK